MSIKIKFDDSVYFKKSDTAKVPPALFFFFITLEPRVEWYTRL
jgi:hypothetical protein